MSLDMKEILEVLKPLNESGDSVKTHDLACLINVLKPESAEELEELRENFKGFTKTELSSMANKVRKKHLKFLPKFAFAPPFKVFKTSELTEWYKALGEIRDPAIKLSVLELLNNLLVEEVRLLVAECDKRVEGGGEELADFVENNLYGAPHQRPEPPFWLKTPFLLAMRDIVARELIFVLSTSFRASLKTNLDSLIVVVEKLMGILDWHDAVEGYIFAPKELMTRLCWIRHFDASRWEKWIADWERAYSPQNLKDRAAAFHKLSSIKRLLQVRTTCHF